LRLKERFPADMLRGMTLGLLVLVCLLPPVFQVAYSVKTGIVSRSRAFAAVFAGLGAVFVASVAQTLLAPPSSAFSGFPLVLVSSFGETALIEELSKLAFIAIVALIGRPAGDRSADGRSVRETLSLALTVGLSFSAFENLSYALGAPSSLWIRMITALPVHAAAAVCSGALVASAGKRTFAAACAFIFAVALHGVYTASLSLRVPAIAPAAASVCVIVVLAVWASRRARRLLRDDDQPDGGHEDAFE
jgi:RsiW-degrading membrane proteinase PrsW (M82 family)